MTTPDPNRLPTFLIIGAAKCGTTSLHGYLDLHPEIGMAGVKEPHFFTGREGWARGPERYAELFDPAFPQRGEASVGYSTFPHTRGVPERIAGLIPDAKIVYLVRDPLPRLVSEYVHRISDGTETRPLNDVVLDMAHSRFSDRGRYYLQIEQYLPYFERERILVMPTERLRDDRTGSLGRVFGFLGVDSEFRSPEFDRALHESRHFRRKDAVGRLLKRASESAAASVVPANTRREIGKILYRPFSRPIDRPRLGPEAEAYAREYYRDDVAALRELLGDPLPEWSI